MYGLSATVSGMKFAFVIPSDAHHEAGHALLHLHHGWYFRYVTMRPRTPGCRALTYGSARKLRTASLAIEQMQIAAAGESAGDIHGHRGVLPDVDDRADYLQRRLGPVVRGEHYDPDLQRFVEAGRVLDTFRPPGSRGPRAWVDVWIETERLLAGPLWPAVSAVAAELLSVRHADYARVRELASGSAESAA